MPEIKKNLLSISKLTQDNNCSITFFANSFLVKNRQGKILDKGTWTAGLYALEEDSRKKHEACFATMTNNKAPYSI